MPGISMRPCRCGRWLCPRAFRSTHSKASAMSWMFIEDTFERVPVCATTLCLSPFFPQLVAGPIQRAGDLLVQIQKPRSLSPHAAYRALFLMLWGFFKKLVIADNVAVIANKVFALRDPTFPILWVGVFAFAVQIYADFSAYTDIARASAQCLGFELSRNFNHPYLYQNSPSGFFFFFFFFWRRWHISLSTWDSRLPIPFRLAVHEVHTRRSSGISSSSSFLPGCGMAPPGILCFGVFTTRF